MDKISVSGFSASFRIDPSFQLIFTFKLISSPLLSITTNQNLIHYLKIIQRIPVDFEQIRAVILSSCAACF